MEPTLSDIRRIAERLGITFVNNGETFDLDIDQPVAIHGTYRATRGGINYAFLALARYEETLIALKKREQLRGH